MLKVREYIDKTKEQALNRCLDELEVTEDQIYLRESEIEAKLFKAKKIKLEVLLKSDLLDYIKEYIKQLSLYLNMEINSEIKVQDEIIQVLLVSDHNALLIKRKKE